MGSCNCMYSDERCCRYREPLPVPGYRYVPSIELGVQCGACGMLFESGKAYGSVCSSISCPIQTQIRC